MSASEDKTWCFWDVTREQRLCSVVGESAFNSAVFHPDGLILGTASNTFGSGESSTVKIWDVREQASVGTFADHAGDVHSLSFSENGYLMATAGVDATVRIWDLRKLKCSKLIEGKHFRIF